MPSAATGSQGGGGSGRAAQNRADRECNPTVSAAAEEEGGVSRPGISQQLACGGGRDRHPGERGPGDGALAAIASALGSVPLPTTPSRSTPCDEADADRRVGGCRLGRVAAVRTRPVAPVHRPASPPGTDTGAFGFRRRRGVLRAGGGSRGRPADRPDPRVELRRRDDVLPARREARRRTPADHPRSAQSREVGLGQGTLRRGRARRRGCRHPVRPRHPGRHGDGLLARWHGGPGAGAPSPGPGRPAGAGRHRRSPGPGAPIGGQSLLLAGLGPRPHQRLRDHPGDRDPAATEAGHNPGGGAMAQPCASSPRPASLLPRRVGGVAVRLRDRGSARSGCRQPWW